jgi:uncharacterized protein YqfA (UPF0365 family)
MASSNTNKILGTTSQVTSRHRTRQAHSINEHETADQNISDDMDVDNASADDETESVTMQASQDGTQGLTDDVQKRLGEMRANVLNFPKQLPYKQSTAILTLPSEKNVTRLKSS